MSLKKNMSIEEIGKVCKKKPIYEETYKKGIVGENKQILETLGREGSFAEILKHGNIGDGVNALTVKIYFNVE